MALALGAELAAAQESQTRHPLIEIVSSQRLADIPFDGQFMTTETFNEYGAATLMHSTGRLIAAYIAYTGITGGRSQIKYVYTDTGRTEFTTVTLDLYAYGTSEIKAVSICEMTGGNIGMILLVDNKASHLYRIHRRIYTVTGTPVSDAEIANWSHDIFTSPPCVIAKGANDYLLIYTKYVSADDHYHFFKRTSADFVTWSGESEMAVGGLTDSWRISDPSILKISTGDLYLFFDCREAVGANGEELWNIYYTVSADGGATWGNASKLTAYDSFDEVGKYPRAVQRIADQITLIFNHQFSCLHMDTGTTGWDPESAGVEQIHYDAANGKLYAVGGSSSSRFRSVIKIDVATWTVEKYWDSGTVPAFNAAFESNYLGHARHDGCYIAVIAKLQEYFAVLDGEANTITHYIFETVGGLTKNVNWTKLHETPNWGIFGVHIDEENDRIYVAINYGGSYTDFEVGYISLTDTGPGYDYTRIGTGNWGSTIIAAGDSNFLVAPESGYAIIGSYHDSADWAGAVFVIMLADGSQYKFYKTSTYPDFPLRGLRELHWQNNRLYGGVTYTTYSGEAEKRGLCEIIFATDSIRCIRPSYASVNSYNLGGMVQGSSGNIMWVASQNYGIAQYDMATGVWVLYNNDNVPNLSPNGTYTFWGLDYDPANDFVFAGAYWSTIWGGISMFSAYGALNQANYRIGTWGGAAWSWTAAAALVQGYSDYDASAAVETGDTNGLYVFWTNENMETGELSIKWDKDGSTKDLSDYIISEKEVSIRRSIEGNPAELEFSVSHGHLFDPYNLKSLYSMYLKKGRKLTVRWGEKISGVDYWRNAGTFYVAETKLSFKRGVYTQVDVKAEDERVLWRHHTIMATDYYQSYPEDLIEDLLLDHAGIPAGGMDIAPFDNRIVIEHQWVEQTLDEIINQICDRFGYYLRFDVDNVARCRKIAEDNAVDHAYSDLTKLISYAPDDSYSDFTNRVVVVGQERSFNDVLYPEERVGGISGTCGWWGYRNDFDVCYSDDRSRRCRNPRLVVIETATSIGFRLSGSITESITYEDPNEKYCTVTVSAPNLVPVLTMLLIAEFAAHQWDPDPVQVGPSGSGFTIPVGSLLERSLLLLIIMILAAVGNFQYEIWAQPVGKIRRSVQGQADDVSHQTEINAVVMKKLEDPLCYSEADCYEVAAQELMVARLQRKRVTITKIAHLQDEDGDTIRLPHPYSGTGIDIFITGITRRFKKGDDGYFIDEIEGWVI